MAGNGLNWHSSHTSNINLRILTTWDWVASFASILYNLTQRYIIVMAPWRNTLKDPSNNPYIRCLQNLDQGGTSSLTHLGRYKMAVIPRTTFSNAFSCTKICEFWLKFHWSLFLTIQLTIFLHWFRWWLGAKQATSHYLNQWCPRLPMDICVTWPKWVNTLGPDENRKHFQVHFIEWKCYILIQIFTRVCTWGLKW